MASLNVSALLKLGCLAGREKEEDAFIQQTDVWGFRHTDKSAIWLLVGQLVNPRGSGLQSVVFR